MTAMLPIPGWPGYFVNDGGDVFSSRSSVIRKLSPGLHKGYLHVKVRRGVGRKTQAKVPVHRLVLLAFKGPRPTLSHESRHLDGNELNNRPGNLEWGTSRENSADQIKHGTASWLRSGEQHNGAKLSDYSVDQIRRLLDEGESQTEIARWYGINQKHVSDIALGRTRTIPA